MNAAAVAVLSMQLLSSAAAPAAEVSRALIASAPVLNKDGLDDAGPMRRAGLASLAGGALLGVVSVGAFTAGWDAERQLRATAHERDVVDGLLLQRAAAAGVGYTSLVLALAGVGAGATLLVLDRQGGGLSDGNEEVTP